MSCPVLCSCPWKAIIFCLDFVSNRALILKHLPHLYHSSSVTDSTHQLLRVTHRHSMTLRDRNTYCVLRDHAEEGRAVHNHHAPLDHIYTKPDAKSVQIGTSLAFSLQLLHNVRLAAPCLCLYFNGLCGLRKCQQAGADGPRTGRNQGKPYKTLLSSLPSHSVVIQDILAQLEAPIVGYVVACFRTSEPPSADVAIAPSQSASTSPPTHRFTRMVEKSCCLSSRNVRPLPHLLVDMTMANSSTHSPFRSSLRTSPLRTILSLRAGSTRTPSAATRISQHSMLIRWVHPTILRPHSTTTWTTRLSTTTPSRILTRRLLHSCPTGMLVQLRSTTRIDSL